MEMKLPRYQTTDPIQFKQNWEENINRPWLAIYKTKNEVGELVPQDYIVFRGTYQEAYTNTLAKWPIRTMEQGFTIIPVEATDV